MRYLLLLLSGCIVAKQSLEMPANDVTTVALLTGTLGHPLDGIARHPWFAVRKKGEREWRIYEVGGGGSTSGVCSSNTTTSRPSATDGLASYSAGVISPTRSMLS